MREKMQNMKMEAKYRRKPIIRCSTHPRAVYLQLFSRATPFMIMWPIFMGYEIVLFIR